MLRLIAIAAVLFVVLTTRSARADTFPRAGKLIEFGHTVTNGKTDFRGGLFVTNGGLAISSIGGESHPGEPPYPPAHANYFVRDEMGHLLVQVQQGQSARVKALGKHGWYLTGDYSTKPPTVILTKEPTTFSRWEFRFDKASGAYFVVNKIDSGKDAWLGMEDNGTPWSRGFTYKPILTPEKKTSFFIIDVEADEGK